MEIHYCTSTFSRQSVLLGLRLYIRLEIFKRNINESWSKQWQKIKINNKSTGNLLSWGTNSLVYGFCVLWLAWEQLHWRTGREMDLHLVGEIRGLAGGRSLSTAAAGLVTGRRPPSFFFVLLDLLLNENEFSEQPLLRDGTVRERRSQLAINLITWHWRRRRSLREVKRQRRKKQVHTQRPQTLIRRHWRLFLFIFTC